MQKIFDLGKFMLLCVDYIQSFFSTELSRCHPLHVTIYSVWWRHHLATVSCFFAETNNSPEIDRKGSRAFSGVFLVSSENFFSVPQQERDDVSVWEMPVICIFLQYQHINYMVNIAILIHIEIFWERLADFGDRPDPH